jgi:hypothetical protein
MTYYIVGAAQLRRRNFVKFNPEVNAPMVARSKRFFGAMALIVLAAGCGQSVSKMDRSALDAKPNVRNSAGAGIFLFEMLQPDVAPASLWKTTVKAEYYPAEYKKSTTITTRYSNCNTPGHIPIIELPRPCKIVKQRLVTHTISPSDITFPTSNTISVVVPSKIIDNNDEYLIAGVDLSLQPCAEKCDTISVRANISCVNDYKENGIISLPLKITYTREAEPTGKHCALVPPDGYGNWLTKGDILARVRGHFGKEDAMVRGHLLDEFSLIPMPDGSWKSNPTAYMENASFKHPCPLLPGMETYAGGEYSILLQKRPAWPVTSTAHIISYRRGDVEICGISALGSDEDGNLQLKYSFVNGRLAQAEQYAPRKNQRETWRFIDGKPMEYIRTVDTSSVAGEMEIWYWHSVAAIAWPEAMNFTPDMLSFADHQRLAEELECCRR